MDTAPTPHHRINHPDDPIDALLARTLAEVNGDDLAAAAAYSVTLSPADQRAVHRRVTAELARRLLGAPFDDDGLPTDFRVIAVLERAGSAGVTIRAMHVERDAQGNETARQISRVEWQELSLGEDTMDLATADRWLTEDGYLRTTAWSTPRTTPGGVVFSVADAIMGLACATTQ